MLLWVAACGRSDMEALAARSASCDALEEGGCSCERQRRAHHELEMQAAGGLVVRCSGGQPPPVDEEATGTNHHLADGWPRLWHSWRGASHGAMPGEKAARASHWVKPQCQELCWRCRSRYQTLWAGAGGGNDSIERRQQEPCVVLEHGLAGPAHLAVSYVPALLVRIAPRRAKNDDENIAQLKVQHRQRI
jgi:hypothetical protein